MFTCFFVGAYYHVPCYGIEDIGYEPDDEDEEEAPSDLSNVAYDFSESIVSYHYYKCYDSYDPEGIFHYFGFIDRLSHLVFAVLFLYLFCGIVRAYI